MEVPETIKQANLSLIDPQRCTNIKTTSTLQNTGVSLGLFFFPENLLHCFFCCELPFGLWAVSTDNSWAKNEVRGSRKRCKKKSNSNSLLLETFSFLRLFRRILNSRSSGRVKGGGAGSCHDRPGCYQDRISRLCLGDTILSTGALRSMCHGCQTIMTNVCNRCVYLKHGLPTDTT